MQQILDDLKFVECYIDDIIIHSPDFDTHLIHLNVTISRLNKANLKINLEKCVWLGLEIKALGYVVSHNKIMMDDSKIIAIKNSLPPQNVRQVQQFLGCCNYYSKFIDNFAKLAKPIFDLLKKDNKFVWTDSANNVFEELKKN